MQKGSICQNGLKCQPKNIVYNFCLLTHRLREDKSIQMFTALVLQLIQCTVQIPKEEDEPLDNQKSLVDRDVLIVKSYEDSLRAAQNFMSIFLKKYIFLFHLGIIHFIRTENFPKN